MILMEYWVASLQSVAARHRSQIQTCLGGTLPCGVTGQEVLRGLVLGSPFLPQAASIVTQTPFPPPVPLPDFSLSHEHIQHTSTPSIQVYSKCGQDHRSVGLEGTWRSHLVQPLC